MMPPEEGFGLDQDNPDVLEARCAACLREIEIESDYVEVFVEKFYADLDEWFPLHRLCYERGLQHAIGQLDT